MHSLRTTVEGIPRLPWFVVEIVHMHYPGPRLNGARVEPRPPHYFAFAPDSAMGTSQKVAAAIPLVPRRRRASDQERPST